MADKLLQFLPEPLREARQPGRAILVGWATAAIPSLALAFLVSLVAPAIDRPVFPFSGWVAILLLVVFAPVIETLIMGAALAILLRFLPPTGAILASAFGWAVAHSMQAAGWGLVIWWPFLVFSTLFVVWRRRSVAHALAIPCVVHALQNLPPALVIAFGQG